MPPVFEFRALDRPARGEGTGLIGARLDSARSSASRGRPVEDCTTYSQRGALARTSSHDIGRGRRAPGTLRGLG